MKLLLINPPYDREPRNSFPTEGLALGYLAAVLRREGHEVEILDARIQRLEPSKILREIANKSFDCLGITVADAQKHNLLAIARDVRKRGKETLIVAGGYLPTLAAERLLQVCPEIDLLVRGEGERTAVDLFEAIDRGEDWKNIRGIAFRQDGEVVLTPPAHLISDLDSIPFPARDSLDQTKESVPVLMVGSRGCYHRCAFCCINSFYSLAGNKPPRYRSAENVVDEMETIVREKGRRRFGFVDDDFVGPSEETKERAVKIAKEIIKRKLGVTFSLEFRADEVDEGLLRLLKEAGLNHVLMGIESGAQSQLDRYCKRVSVEQNVRAIETVRNAGVKLTSGFIMFDPYTKPQEVVENMQFLRETRLRDDRIAANDMTLKLKLFHGLPLTERVRADGLLREKGLDLDYVFQNPQTKFVFKTFSAITTLSSAVKNCVGFFLQRKPPSPESDA